MFRIRRIYEPTLTVNQQAIIQVQHILRTQFPSIPQDDIVRIPEKLRNPVKHGFFPILFVAEDEKGRVQGFAMLLYESKLNFCYLDYISAADRLTGRGVGGALYERLRQEAGSLNAMGIFFEALPDDPHLSRDPVIRKQNSTRLKFYERYGARPIINTAYETPVKPGEDNPPYLVFDNLGTGHYPSRDQARKVVRFILEHKYKRLVSKAYIDLVCNSFKDDVIQLRKPKYSAKDIPGPRQSMPDDQKIALVVTDCHEIHHIRERGYVESPVRIKHILQEIEPTGLFMRRPIKKFPGKHINAVHDPQFVRYLNTICKNLPPRQSLYPYVFPIRNHARPPRVLAVRAGYYCIDTFTPLGQNVFQAAKRAVDCALTGVTHVLEGTHLTYALVRPPGHHAEWNNFGGFCYFNSNAVAAEYLSHYGKVAILDVDYHHGNGQQDIFYQRSDVLTISIHGHPGFAYPYFSGFEDEKGFGLGEGFNVNYPLPEDVDGTKYLEVLQKALKKIARFKADFLIVALGLDTAKGDPTGSWALNTRDFEQNGRLIGALKIPTLVVQEGGYDQRKIGVNARYFFTGLWKGYFI